jgi:hypothetical protein
VVSELRQSETQPVVEPITLADHTFLYKTSFWLNFAMTSVETLYMKNGANELSFLLVTHTTCFDIRSGRYGFLKLGFSARQIVNILDIHVLAQVFWTTRWVRLARV